MKRQIVIARQLVAALLLMVTLNSCFKDNCTHSYGLYTPVYKTLTEVRANMKSNAPQQVKRPGKIYLLGNYIFLNESERGIHVIDNSQPANPKMVSFIDIPGNVDMAVKGNTLYADSYSDLVAFDISNPKQVTAKKFLNNAFPHRNVYYQGNSSNPDSVKVVVDWLRRDTTVDCQTYQYLYANYYSNFSADNKGNYAAMQLGSSAGGGGGIGGSMARFTLLNNHLYTVSNNDLKIFDISAPQDPSFVNQTNIGWGIETIYPFKDKLFIGSTTGMFIYDVANPVSPNKLSQFTHIRSCDPVIADENNAFVTLRSGTLCGGAINQMDVLNITNLSAPILQKTYPFTSPHGLSKEGNLLFICDGKDGLKVYDATNVTGIKLLKHLTGLDTYDVIAWNKRALVTAADGLYQFDYSDPGDIRLISKIGISK